MEAYTSILGLITHLKLLYPIWSLISTSKIQMDSVARDNFFTAVYVFFRAGEPAIFLAAPAPHFFFKRLWLRIFFPSGSGSWL